MQLPYDFRFAWAGAKLVFPFVRRGIAPEGLSTYLLPQLIGFARAKGVFLSGATLSPSSPLLTGLYHDILPERADVFPAALAFAKELAANTSQVAVAYTKGLLVHPPQTVGEVLRLESVALDELSRKGDASEAARAFKERRPAKMTDGLSDLRSAVYPWVSALFNEGGVC